MRISDATFVIYDLETCGLDPATDRIVEIAGKFMRFGAGGLEGIRFFQTLVDPGVPIPPQTMAIHHIRDEDVVNAPTWEDACADIEAALRNEGTVVWVAHNGSEFDDRFVYADEPFRSNARFLDTKRLAQHLLPDAPGYSNQTLRYYLGLSLDMMGTAPHRALADVIVTAALLDSLLQVYCETSGTMLLDDLLGFAASPILYTSWPLGKYRNQPLGNAPDDYVEWCLRSMSDLKPDLRYSLGELLRKRTRPETSKS